jgi:hypothetical protein
MLDYSLFRRKVSLRFSILLSVYIYDPTALVDLDRVSNFLIYTQSVGLLVRGISPPQGRNLLTEQHKQNKRTQTFVSRVRFEPMIPVFEQAKTYDALDPAATVIYFSFFK